MLFPKLWTDRKLKAAIKKEFKISEQYVPIGVVAIVEKENNSQVTEATSPTAYSTANTNSIRPMADIEREVIQNAIDHCDGNVLNAAVLLELSPSTLYRKKQAWEAYEESDS